MYYPSQGQDLRSHGRASSGSEGVPIAPTSSLANALGPVPTSSYSSQPRSHTNQQGYSVQMAATARYDSPLPVPLHHDYDVAASLTVPRQLISSGHQRAWSDSRRLTYPAGTSPFTPFPSVPNPQPQPYATDQSHSLATPVPLATSRHTGRQQSAPVAHPNANFLDQFTGNWAQPSLPSASGPTVHDFGHGGASYAGNAALADWNSSLTNSERSSPGLSLAYNGAFPATFDAPSPAVSVHSSGCESVSVGSTRKRRIDTSQSPNLKRSSVSPMDGEDHEDGADAKRPRWSVSETQHVHIINVECPHMDCIGPIHGKGGDKHAPGSFICGYVEPLSGLMCASEFRRRGCRDRHSASHSGREAQDVTAGRLGITSARRLLWESIRVVEVGDWQSLYPPVEMSEGGDTIAEWASHVERATESVRHEFNLSILEEEAKAFRQILIATGATESQQQGLLSDSSAGEQTISITPVDLSSFHLFKRLAMKRAVTFERFYCRHPRCEVDFTRMDALVRHRRTCHKPKKTKAKPVTSNISYSFV